MTKKLEFAFDLYDQNRNGYLDRNEIRQVISGMLDLIGACKTVNNENQVADECFRMLDVDADGQVSKGISYSTKIYFCVCVILNLK